MARRNKRNNKKANRAERRAKNIQAKIKNIKSGGGGNKKSAKSRVQALRSRRNQQEQKAKQTRRSITKSGGTVRDTVNSGRRDNRSTPRGFRNNKTVSRVPAPNKNAGRKVTTYGGGSRFASANASQGLAKFNVPNKNANTGRGPIANAVYGGGNAAANAFQPTRKQGRQGYFEQKEDGSKGDYNYGKNFNRKDVRRMKAGGMSGDDVYSYAESKAPESKVFQNMTNRRQGQFDKQGNYDYGKRFNAADISRMSSAGVGTQAMADFIQSDPSLAQNTFAQDWLKNNQGSGGGGKAVTTGPEGVGTTETNTGTDPTQTTDSGIDTGLKSDFSESQEYMDLTQQIADLQSQLNEYQGKELGEGTGEGLGATEKPKTDSTEGSSMVIGGATGGSTPGATLTGATGAAYDPLAWLKDYQQVGAPQFETPETKTGDGGAKDLTESTEDSATKTEDKKNENTTTTQAYEPYSYQPIGAENLAEQNMVLNRIGMSSGYNPSGAGNPYVNPTNPFTARAQPVGTNGLPTYPGMTYGPGTAPIPGQVVPGGVTPGFAQAATPAIPGDPAMKGKQKPNDDGDYASPKAPTVSAPLLRNPVYTPLNQLGL